MLTEWVSQQNLTGFTFKVSKLENKTPLLFCEVQGNGDKTVLLYGHFDKQPPFEGWREGLGPYTPVVTDGKLYGRAAADDGYSLFSAVVAIAALQKEGKPHPRCVIMIEGSEESGSPDLPAHFEALKKEIGKPDLVICLDSGAGSYDRLWITTSLRGILVGDLKVSVLTEGVHSGDASGVVPSSMRIARALLSKLENETTGEIKPKSLYAKMTKAQISAAKQAGETLGKAGMVDCFPFVDGTEAVAKNNYGTLALNRWWKPQLEVIGAMGLPPSAQSGNVLRPWTQLTLSLRLPPTLDKAEASEAVRKTLLDGVIPHKAKVEFNVWKASQGWSSPASKPWLETSMHESSKRNFDGKEAVFQGEGGSIPFMAMLGVIFPEALFFVTGVLGPASNAHGPNEFLHLDYCQRVTACVAEVLADTCAAGEAGSAGEAKEAEAASGAKRPRVEGLEKEYGRNKDGSKV